MQEEALYDEAEQRKYLALGCSFIEIELVVSYLWMWTWFSNKLFSRDKDITIVSQIFR